MAIIGCETLPIRSDNEVVMVRHRVRECAVRQGFGLVDQTKIITAASELARNVLVHGGGGTVLIELLNNAARKGLKLTFEDQGPGIPDVSLALRDGFTTSGGLGLGLSGAKRLSNEFEIDSRVGEGTRVSITRWK